MDYWISVILRKWWALNQINIIYNTLFVWKFSCSTFCSDLSLSERKTEYGNIDVTKSHISAVHHHFSLPECLAERNNEIALFFVLIIVRWANMNIQWGLHDPAIDPSAFVSVRSHFFLSFITSYSWFWFHLIYSHSNYLGIVSWPYNVLIWFCFPFKLPSFWCATRQNLFNHKLDVNHKIWYISRDIGNFKLS